MDYKCTLWKINVVSSLWNISVTYEKNPGKYTSRMEKKCNLSCQRESCSGQKDLKKLSCRGDLHFLLFEIFSL